MAKKISSIKELSAAIKEKAGKKKRFVIAISGFAGSGKSTISKKLAEILDKSLIIELDDFIMDRLSARSADWDGFDWQRLIKQVLRPLRGRKETIEYEIYDWQNNKLGEKMKSAVPKYIMIEGVGLIQKKLNSYFDCKIWLDVPLEIATIRGKKRDRKGGPNHNIFWNKIWTLNDADYFAKHKPVKYADFVFKNE